MSTRIVVRRRPGGGGAHRRGRRNCGAAGGAGRRGGAGACFCGCCRRPAAGGWVRRSACGAFATAGARSRWTGPWPGRCRGRPPRPAQSAVVHAGDSLDDLIAFTRQVRAGDLPDESVPGDRPAIAASIRPGAAGWPHPLGLLARAVRHAGRLAAHREAFADRIERRIEGLAPGFRGLIRGRAIAAPPDLEAMDENLVGGDLGGGSAHFDQQLFLRPVFPYFRYRTPVAGALSGLGVGAPRRRRSRGVRLQRGADGAGRRSAGGG